MNREQPTLLIVCPAALGAAFLDGLERGGVVVGVVAAPRPGVGVRLR